MYVDSKNKSCQRCPAPQVSWSGQPAAFPFYGPSSTRQYTQLYGSVLLLFFEYYLFFSVDFSFALPFSRLIIDMLLKVFSLDFGCLGQHWNANTFGSNDGRVSIRSRALKDAYCLWRYVTASLCSPSQALRIRTGMLV